jgi:hypothetical protein
MGNWMSKSCGTTPCKSNKREAIRPRSGALRLLTPPPERVERPRMPRIRGAEVVEWSGVQCNFAEWPIPRSSFQENPEWLEFTTCCYRQVTETVPIHLICLSSLSSRCVPLPNRGFLPSTLSNLWCRRSIHAVRRRIKDAIGCIFSLRRCFNSPWCLNPLRLILVNHDLPATAGSSSLSQKLPVAMSWLLWWAVAQFSLALTLCLTISLALIPTRPDQ